MKRPILQFGIADVFRLTATLAVTIATITALRGPLLGEELAIGSTIFVAVYVGLAITIRWIKRLIVERL